MRKLKLETRAELVMFSLANGVIGRMPAEIGASQSPARWPTQRLLER